MSDLIAKLSVAHTNALVAMENAAKAFQEKHPEDKGECGIAVARVVFGRKQKVKNAFYELGITTSKESQSTIHCWPENKDYSQWRQFNEAYVRAYVKEMKAVCAEFGIEIYMDSWTD